MNRKFRLNRSSDFMRVRRLGKSYAHPLTILIVYRNEQQDLRFGFAAGRSLGGAVERNRAKRLLRAVVQSLMVKISPGWDLIFMARKPLLTATFGEIYTAVDGLLERAHLVRELVNDPNARPA